MKTLTLTITGLALLITACNSFNRIELAPPYKLSIKEQGISVKQDKELLAKKFGDKLVPVAIEAPIAVKTRIACPPFMLPALPATPELPIEEIGKLTSSDMAKLDVIQLKHIADLREHITTVKIAIRNAQQEHMHKCYSSTGPEEEIKNTIPQ